VADIKIPAWMDELAPGAAQAARNISSGELALDPIDVHFIPGASGVWPR
jgi:hypothetical protein